MISTEICQICLAIDCKMYSVEDPIKDVFKALVNLKMSSEVMMAVCWECAGRLRSAAQLRQRAHRAQTLLASILKVSREINTDDLKMIDRAEHRLTSYLKSTRVKITNIEPVKEESDEVKQEIIELKEVDASFNRNPAGDVQPNLCFLPVEDIKDDGFIDENDDDIVNKILSDDENDIVDENDIDDADFCEEYMSLRSLKAKKELRRLRKCDKRKAGSKALKEKREKSDCFELSSRSRTRKKTARMKEVEKALSKGFKITRLTHEQQLEEFEKKKEHRRYLRLPYKCTLCLTAFSKEYKYSNHMTRHNEEWGKYECRICKIRTKTQRRLRKHVVGWHSEKYSCRQCKMFTKNRSVACRHLEWHSGTVIKCPLCPAEFTHSSTYLSHRRLKHVSEYVCELCGYSFIGQRGIQTHKYRMHPLEAEQNTPLILKGPHCSECNVKFISQEAYDRHLALSSKHSSDETLRELRNDGKLPSLLKPIDNETRRALIRRPITCELCGAVVLGKMAYSWHFRKTHPGQERRQFPAAPPTAPRVYLCDKCGKTFTNYNLWWSHMLVHSVDKRFQCELCKKQFNRHNTYAMHLQNHSAAREKFECPQCGQNLSNKGNLARHLLIHGGQRPYKCSSCDKSFNNSDGLRAHTNHVHLKIPWPARVRSSRRQNED